MKTPTDRLIELHAREGFQFKELAPFTCPLCGVRPIYSVKPDTSERLVECGCCAPLYSSPTGEGRRLGPTEFFLAPHVKAWGERLSPWELMPDEKAWRKFVNGELGRGRRFLEEEEE